MIVCPKCGSESQDDAVFCDQCGARLQQPVESTAVVPTQGAPPAQGGVCPSCGHANTPGEAFCEECGAPLSAPQPEPTAVVQTGPPTAQPSGSKACPACGATITGDEEFCYACGVEMRTFTAAEPVAPASPQPAEPVTPEPVAPAATAPPSPAPKPDARLECPACGARISPGDAFCEYCGAALVGPTREEAAATAQPVSQPAVRAAEPAPAAPGPRLIVLDSGVEIPLRLGQETLVGREDSYAQVYPDVDLTPHGGEEGGVSRRHFKITPSGQGYAIEDLNSTNYTLLNRQQLQPGVLAALSDGDEIRAGRVRLIFRMSS